LPQNRPPTDPWLPPEVAAAVGSIPFQDPESAKLSLADTVKRVSPALAAALPGLLAESPDPDSALLLFDRLVSESSEEIVHLLNRHNALAHYAIVVFGHSRYLSETLLQNTDLLQALLREKNLDRSFSRDEFYESLARFRSRSFETDVSVLLARFKRREYIRIMLRDVLKIAPLAETTAEISALADVLIEEALHETDSTLQKRYGLPRHLDAKGRLVNTPFAVLSLGKLGGNELNYSSDVDLLYIFGDGKESAEAPISNHEYFIRLAQQVTEILSRITREGPVFRIDLRLRPQGSGGELAISLINALHYYGLTAHDWERQALIKVRRSAGDPALASEFIRRVQPEVYTAQINFAAIKTALVAREKMQSRGHLPTPAEASGQSIDVKIDRGGIRDIEFLVQCLQRVYGGGEPWLRSGGTLFSLQKLHDKVHLSGKEFHDLTSAYEFLRHLEHRLQLRQGQQTHRLASSEHELAILQRSMEGYAPGEYLIADLVTIVRLRMAVIAEIYQRVIYQQQTLTVVAATDSQFQLCSAPESTASDQSMQQILQRLAADAPELYQIAIRHDLGLQTRKNLFRFLSSAFTSSERYAAILRNSKAVSRSLILFDASDYLTDILVRHPEEIATVSDLENTPNRVGSGYLFESPLGQGRAAADPVFAYVASSAASYGEKLALLRQHFRHRVFTVGARDIIELRGVYESLGAITAAAEDVIAAAVGIAGNPPGLAVLALGRLGSGELDVLSDADLLFVCDEDRDRERLKKSVEQIVQALAAYTRDGMAFPVDTRLRPRGGEGELLVTPAQLTSYFKQEAQGWEALTYTKLRFLSGSQSLGRRVSIAATDLFDRFAGDETFLHGVRAMRTKLELVDPSGNNFKTSPGGIYDIDFLSAYLLVMHAIPHKHGSLRDRLWRCAAADVLDKSDAATLDHAAELLRTVQHIARLTVGRGIRWLPRTNHARLITEKITAKILRREFADGLETELLQTLENVRKIYERVMS
jgi:[glutamine synthetase] adenylyltransferase / [glutamine synthetase]-adenylyl-L-tyrosine phosphorylase